jgi:hypothetical protein
MPKGATVGDCIQELEKGIKRLTSHCLPQYRFDVNLVVVLGGEYSNFEWQLDRDNTGAFDLEQAIRAHNPDMWNYFLQEVR